MDKGRGVLRIHAPGIIELEGLLIGFTNRFVFLVSARSPFTIDILGNKFLNVNVCQVDPGLVSGNKIVGRRGCLREELFQGRINCQATPCRHLPEVILEYPTLQVA